MDSPYTKFEDLTDPPTFQAIQQISAPLIPMVSYSLPVQPDNPAPTVCLYSQHLAVGPKEQTMICPGCKQTIKTIVRHRTTTRTHILACMTCLFCLPFMCVPYCMDTCRDGNHYCPHCDSFIGTYKA